MFFVTVFRHVKLLPIVSRCDQAVCVVVPGVITFAWCFKIWSH